jgi:hypothetical protein
VYPQVEDRRIEAAGRTVAPFTKGEKPQLSPWLAASFIKKAAVSAGYLNIVQAAARRKSTAVEWSKLRLGLLLLAFRDDPTEIQLRVPLAQIDLRRTLYTSKGYCPSSRQG